MKILLGSDYHFGHEKLVTDGKRPAGYESRIMEHSIRANNDPERLCLVNLGDIVFSSAGKQVEASYLKSNRANKRILIPGNHDGTAMAAMDRGWDFACHEFILDAYGVSWVFTHEPMPETYIPYGHINVHGHLHIPGEDEHRGDIIRDNRHVLISSELLDYRPISLEQVFNLTKRGVYAPMYKNGKFVDYDYSMGKEKK